jgi:hypothetical protein
MDVGIVDALLMVNKPPMGAVFPVPHTFRALVDTGAQRTLINPSVVTALNLTPIGKVGLQGIGGAVNYTNGYLFHGAFTLPAGAPQPVAGGQFQQPVAIFVHNTVIHGGLLSSGLGFDVLLGMDVIGGGSLHIEGSGTFSFSF